VALDLFGFLVRVVFLLCFVCGKRGWFTQPLWMYVGECGCSVGVCLVSVCVSMLVVCVSCFLGLRVIDK